MCVRVYESREEDLSCTVDRNVRRPTGDGADLHDLTVINHDGAVAQYVAVPVLSYKPRTVLD